MRAVLELGQSWQAGFHALTDAPMTGSVRGCWTRPAAEQNPASSTSLLLLTDSPAQAERLTWSRAVLPLAVLESGPFSWGIDPSPGGWTLLLEDGPFSSRMDPSPNCCFQSHLWQAQKAATLAPCSAPPRATQHQLGV